MPLSILARPAAPLTAGMADVPPSRLRRMGQGLALPIAAMPAAGLILRLGQDDLLGRVASLHRLAAVLSGAGAAILDYLPLLFAIGLGLGMSRSKETAGPVLACVVSYLVLSRVILVLNPLPPGELGTPPARWPYGALAGIAAGLLALAVWKGAEKRRLPPFVAHGLVILAALLTGTLLGVAYPVVAQALNAFASGLADHTVLGGATFGFLNRILLPIGMHQIPNAAVWYVSGSCGDGVTGDVPCFFTQHDPHAGVFLGGFYPIAMFALPAAALAMWRAAPPEGRRKAGALLLPAAAMSALTGITEPIEFAFAYVAAPLYVLHALLTGVSLGIVNALDIHTGFLFSAGAIDFGLNFSISTRPLLILPIGLAYGALYYLLFGWAIRRFNLRTPGRPGATSPPSDHPADVDHQAKDPV